MATKKSAGARRSARVRAVDLPTGWEDAFSLKNETIETSLQTGDNAGLLEDYFGAEQYTELRQLAQEAQSSRSRGGPRVLILPGILGSTIGANRIGPFDDVYWLDPKDVALGNLADLRLLPSAPKKLEALGVILFAYLKLKLHLNLDGYDADFFPFDWRKPIRDAAEALLAQLKQESASEVNIVAHSMGGLIARAAMTIGASGAAKKIRRLIMLGTPNHGSFAPVQAVRATYGTVRTVAALDLKHRPNAAEWLSTNVFSTFPGLYQMLPDRTVFSGVNLYKAAQWPAGNPVRPVPRQALLDGVEAAQKLLAPGNEKMTLIAGVNVNTTVDLRVQGNALEYGLSPIGDGTVPLEFARLAGVAQTYYVEETHGSLPNNTVVARAVADILDSGATKRLPTQWQPPTTQVEWRSEMEVRTGAFRAAEPAPLSQRQIRESIAEFAAPTARDTGPLPITTGPAAVISPTAGYEHTFQHVIVGRRWQRRLEVRLARGSVTEVDARAVVLGVFQDVTPGGPARALDERMGGLITDLTQRRMFTGRVGEIFMMPVGRGSIRADLIAFAGLGAFDRFNHEVQQIVAENVIRTFIRANVEEFATVLLGAGSGGGAAKSLQNLLIGFLRGLTDADTDHRFRRLILCENNAGAYQQMKEEFFRLASTEICRNLEITFDEEVLPQPAAMVTARGAAPREDDNYTYLVIRNENTKATTGGKATRVVRSSLLTAGGKASVISGTVPFDDKAIKAIQNRVSPRTSPDSFPAIGQEIAEVLLPESVRTVLGRSRNHLVVVHDAETSRVPWELLHIDGWFPAAEAGLSHRYTADDLSIAKYLEERRRDNVLDMLLVVDPTEDLTGAVEEGKRVLKLFESKPDVRIDKLWQREATKPAVLAALRSGRYDVVHYAGHAFFDPVTPANSGILCSGKAVLSGSDLSSIGDLPALMFFNACEAARVRSTERQMQEATGLAESFLRGGVANYLGTFWPVGDTAAEKFATTFYAALLDGKSMRAAIQQGRKVVKDLPGGESRDWADYVHYGHPGFVLKNVVREE